MTLQTPKWMSIAFFIIMNALTNKICIGQCSIKGLVKDLRDAPVVNAHIVPNYSEKGTLTNHNGQFSLTTENCSTATLVVSCLGYKKYSSVVNTTAKPAFVEIVLEDSITNLNEVVVTASRIAQRKTDLAVPVQVIGREEIKKGGFVRLNEVLSEQTGLQMVADHGAGLQIQGLSSEYILVLVNGDPVIGRTAGTLDLSRIAIGNIERIEIIKGPSSSLYGNEALAGVVNIITTKENTPRLEIASLARTHRTVNTNLATHFNWHKLGVFLFADRLSSAGYDLNSHTISQTSPPFVAYTFQPKLSYRFSEKTAVELNSVYFTDKQQNNSTVTEGSETIRLNEETIRKDLKVISSLKINCSSKHTISFKNSTDIFYATSLYRHSEKEGMYDENNFRQWVNRTELMHHWKLNSKNMLLTGGGLIYESVDASRYNGINTMNASYFFVQYNGKTREKLNFSPSTRYDFNGYYGSCFNPKLAINYRPANWISFKGSVGTGFKTPDFRQLLLNFTNPTVGYTVLGASIARTAIKPLITNGEVDLILTDLNNLGKLQPEKSLALNLGMDFTLTKDITIRTNLFFNRISNLIETAPIARKTNGQYVYSYFNLNKIITKGTELNLNFNLLTYLQGSVSYQFLQARDMEMLDLVKAGKVYRRNAETGETERVKTKEYGGLPNRSMHSGNVKLHYENQLYHFGCTLRGIFRGPWGIGDLNGNKILDTRDEYAKEYLLWNFSITKEILKCMNWEAGIRNLMGTTSPNDPSLSGRIWHLGFLFTLTGKNKKQST